MIPEKSLKFFHKYLNFFIFILTIIVLIMMFRLLRKETFAVILDRFSNGNNSNNKQNALSNDALTEITKCQTCNPENKPLIFVAPENTHSTSSNEGNTTLVEVSSSTPITNSNGNLNENITQNVINKANELNSNNSTNTMNSNNNVSVSNNIPDFEEELMLKKVKNFILHPDEQQYCPNLENSINSFWAQLPEDYAGDHHAKFCCTSCYSLISKEIYCGENMNGKYMIDYLSNNDFAELKELFEGKLTDKGMVAPKILFPEMKMNSLLGKPVLKYRYGDKYYVIQVIKSYSELIAHEDSPAIVKELYQRHYKCPNVATKPVIQFV